MAKAIEQAVIWAGGRGERLRPLTDHLPKPMAPVEGRPFLDYLLKPLVDAGIKRVLILTGYKAQVIEDRYRPLSSSRLEFHFSRGKEEDQTGRRLLNAYDQLEEDFLLLYGDNFWPLPLRAMEENRARLQVPVTTTVFRNRQGTAEYGFENNTEVGADGKVKRYDKSRKSPGLNGVDMGFFLVSQSILDPRRGGNPSFEEEFLPPLVSAGQLGAFQTDEQYYFITDLKLLRDFEERVPRLGLRPWSL